MAFKCSLCHVVKTLGLNKGTPPKACEAPLPLNPIKCLPPEGKELYLGMHGKKLSLSEWSKRPKHRSCYEY